MKQYWFAWLGIVLIGHANAWGTVAKEGLGRLMY